MNTVICPVCSNDYLPHQFIYSIIRIKKKDLSELIAPMEKIQKVQRDIVEATNAEFDGDLDQHLESINGNAFEEDRLMPVSLLLCKSCTESLRNYIGKGIESITIPKHLDGRLGVTEYNKETVEKCGVDTKGLEERVKTVLRKLEAL